MSSQSFTIPTANTVLPNVPSASTANQETSPTLVNAAKSCAKAKLKQRNRKGKELVIEFPVTSLIVFEAGTIYQCSGFSPLIDSFKWRVSDVEIKIRGKTGAGVTVTLAHVPQGY